MEWISVEERLPERIDPRQMRALCVVALDNGTVAKCDFEFDNEFLPGYEGIYSPGWHQHDGIITHWMPWTRDMIGNLPDPPQRIVSPEIFHTYSFPELGFVKDLVVTNDRETAKRYIGQGYALSTVPQMFGEETGTITLYLEDQNQKASRMSEEDASHALQDYETASREMYAERSNRQSPSGSASQP